MPAVVTSLTRRSAVGKCTSCVWSLSLANLTARICRNACEHIMNNGEHTDVVASSLRPPSGNASSGTLCSKSPPAPGKTNGVRMTSLTTSGTSGGVSMSPPVKGFFKTGRSCLQHHSLLPSSFQLSLHLWSAEDDILASMNKSSRFLCITFRMTRQPCHLPQLCWKSGWKTFLSVGGINQVSKCIRMRWTVCTLSRSRWAPGTCSLR